MTADAEPVIEIDKIPIPPYAGYIGADGQIVPPAPAPEAEPG